MFVRHLNSTSEFARFPEEIQSKIIGRTNLMNVSERVHRGEPVLPTSEPMIRLAGLTVNYGSFRAVDGLDLDIRGGELFGLLGPNGAGKSTTMRVLIGQRRPNGGTATVAGLD